jgi:hypothetical protein
MLITSISAVSIVIFPMLKTMDDAKKPDIYALIRTMLILPLLMLLTLYPFMLMLLQMWLPPYADSLKYLAILLPLCIYETRNLILTDTFYKAYQRTSAILMVNIIAIGISLALTVLSVYVLGNLDFAVASIIVIIMLKSAISEYGLKQNLGKWHWKDILAEACLAFIFVFSNWSAAFPLQGFLYPAGLLVYILLKRRSIKALYLYLITLVRSKPLPQ